MVEEKGGEERERGTNVGGGERGKREKKKEKKEKRERKMKERGQENEECSPLGGMDDSKVERREY